ncbi:PTS fructose transporter subunit IIB, partial [Corallococcus soli]
MAKLVAVTACPTGIAHTFMAAEALRRVADLKGHDLTVETRGAEGVRTPLDDAAVEQADAVILATDITVDESRFVGKPLVRTSTAVAIRDTERIIDEAVARATLHRTAAASGDAGPPGATPPDAARAGTDATALHGDASRPLPGAPRQNEHPPGASTRASQPQAPGLPPGPART